jgi:rfaE bifunctional protein nucleotidyltransferase chain/domain
MKQQSAVFSTAKEAKTYIDTLRVAGKKLVTTNGCFDIIHAGHIKYLADAAALGDILAVGVNADESVRRLKGPARPINGERDRLAVIGALRMVDCAFLFREDDPRAFLEILRPDAHVKGGDYQRALIERGVVEKHGGKIEIVPFLSGYSTTGMVDKIKGKGTR